MKKIWLALFVLTTLAFGTAALTVATDEHGYSPVATDEHGYMLATDEHGYILATDEHGYSVA
ncbi:hypothetical protein [Effusibacillus consociatus]|uniref:Uncharacterized protein n=1 Tax=Effusibacillus consociatus TaxID=1117041 RepID=A0ABV9Q3P2_9BACL